MSQKFDPDYNNNRGGGFDIPVWVIVLSLIFATPLGIVLLILNSVSKSDIKKYGHMNGDMLEREIRRGVEKGLRGIEKGFKTLEREFSNTHWNKNSNEFGQAENEGNSNKQGDKANDGKIQNSTPQYTGSAYNEEKDKFKIRKIKREAPEVISLIAAVVFLLAGISKIDNIIAAPFGLAGLFDVISGVIPFIGAGVSYVAHIFFKRSRERCAVYARLIGDAEYFKLDTLVSATGASKAKVRREMQNMIVKGIFGSRAYIDFSRDMFFRSSEAASEYNMSSKTENISNTSTLRDEEPFKDRAEQDEYRRIILEIRRLNDEIANIAVSERIYRIEEHTQHIFDYVKEHPERRGNIRTFMNYYLPTTLKLLTSYAKIERVGVAGDNMKKSKQSIEETLDMLVYAFEREVDMLFESESIDISTDIDVLEAMLRRDGFSGGIEDTEKDGNTAASAKPKSDTDKQI
ncbi:MAG: hypothetical protein HFE30_05730 [Clostridiales bacterium]|nr:hypothetical protein [Clostridiales bacterium]